ncbi:MULTISPECIES: protein-L-isoaspartate O-methyltransferase family protein [Pseudovibrio]|uniref:protein-L-isoaspartate O-methyltransferase family protein n=1 Tax=Stappiaceae TaxID=2821832 RepID=UPI00236690B7|nr:MULTISPECIES: protein-L-isoaspartate O-methyltransferase [Pseudovibrio]MDD7908467.1 protein-L-isoaspartate O-methyltransferase [Pseudovibrio exalbescens]MDX5592667.1 protein-L-isoaspartate O-methyltransferase [Pseudovibrio sp. SPO723]
MADYVQSRTRMVDNQLRTNDITDLRILDAMGEVPRETFVPEEQKSIAYIDEDIPMNGAGLRKMLKPHILGKLLQLASIAKDDVVLVVGAGTGYSVAIASKLCDSVVGVEQDEAMAAEASTILADLGIENAAVIDGEMRQGYASDAPYDVIVIDGSVESIPSALFDQLKNDGRLVAIEQSGPTGEANIYYKTQETVSSRFAFNASGAPLPGFEKPKSFTF